MHPILRTALVVPSLIAAATGQRLIAIDTSRALFEVDLVTAQKTLLSTVGAAVGTTVALAFDPATSTLYVSSSSTDALWTVDVATGVPTLVGPFGNPALNMQGIELDLSSGVLYGVSAHDGGLYTIDRTTGAATLRGITGLAGNLNLAYDAATDSMYTTSTTSDCVYRLDRTTAAVTLLGNMAPAFNAHGFAFQPSTGVLYAVDNASDQLYAIDPRDGDAHPVGSTGAGNLVGLAYVPGGTGSLVRQPHGCGAATIFAHGSTRPAGSITVLVEDTTGVPFVGFGLQPAAIPFCGCTIGHEWAVALAGGTATLALPPGPALLGTQVGIQGVDLFGAGGCADPQLALTDSLVLTIG